ncbi:insulinase family protein [Pasteurellaceae bacterium LIM206]|nr:insulinase family protein [Pasteurellaceae bacterium LIM206]
MRIIITVLLLYWSFFVQAETVVKPVQGQLDNGLRYVILPLEKQPGRVDIAVRVYAGGIDENEHQYGGAHIVEHMVFNASEKHPEGVMPYLHQHGWLRGKHYNAYTTHDHTTYFYLPPRHFTLEQTLDVVREMLFSAQMTEKDLIKERKIVLEEWRTRDGARRRIYEQRQSSNRANSRYVNRSVIGSAQSISEMPIEALRAFYHKWYVPNNMQIVLVGDLDVVRTKDLLTRFFAQFPAKPLAERHYYDPTLQARIQVDRIADPQNSNSQVEYLWRFDDTASFAQTEAGFHQRMIDSVVLGLINQRFLDEKAVLPQALSALTAKKFPIGKHTSALAFSVNVEKTAHSQGIQFLIEQAERLKKYPFTAVELKKQKEKIRAKLVNDRNKQANFTFDDWMQEMVNTLLSEKNFYPQDQLESMSRQSLERINLKTINQRIAMWLDASDQVVQYMPPLKENVPEIKAEQIKQWQVSTQNRPLVAPKETNLVTFNLPALNQQGEITHTTGFARQNVVYWQLSNGDKVVWLKSPLAKDKTYFVAQSQAGSFSPDFVSWQGKLALQLIGKNAPLNWTHTQLQEWKEQNQIPLVMRQGFDQLNLISTVENSHLETLFRFYYANQLETKLKENVDKTKEEWANNIKLQQHSSDFKRNQAWEQFTYGKLLNPQPELTALAQISAATLESVWQKMVSQPVTYFIVNDVDETRLKTAIIHSLAIIPRGKVTEKALPPQVLSGAATERFALNREPKDNIYLSMFNEYEWSVKNYLTANLLSLIASEKLSQKMRDEKHGIYGKKFSSKLSAELHRLQSVLTFSADPKNSQTLIDTAKQVLRELPENITQADLAQAQKYLFQLDEDQKAMPEQGLERLIFSEKYYHDPHYLTQWKPLVDAVTLADVKAMAKAVYSDQNQRLFLTTPIDEK